MSKSPSRKSIIANFGLLSADIDADADAAEKGANAPEPTVSAPHVPRVGAGVIGATQRAISDIRDERDRLQALLDAGGTGAQDLNPEIVDPSPFPDRLPDDDLSDFEQFKKTIESDGQRVPIQVRPHPQRPGRYQVIYGHRRLRAARELELPVKALILEMSDRDLVMSQGIENAARQDLTWIERALFARQMDDADIKPRDIKGALSVDDAELARMRAVYRSVPSDIIEKIGRASKIGRPRWIDFAKRLGEEKTSLGLVRKTLSADKVLGLSSNDRFTVALQSLIEPRVPTEMDDQLRSRDGTLFGRLRVSKKEVRLIVDADRGAEFGEFVRQQLPDLIERFLKGSEKE